MAWDTKEDWWVNSLFEASVVITERWITVRPASPVVILHRGTSKLSAAPLIATLACQSLLIIISVITPDCSVVVESLTSPATCLSACSSSVSTIRIYYWQLQPARCCWERSQPVSSEMTVNIKSLIKIISIKMVHLFYTVPACYLIKRSKSCFSCAWINVN